MTTDHSETDGEPSAHGDGVFEQSHVRDFPLTGGGLVLYDPDNPDAWLRSTASRSVRP